MSTRKINVIDAKQVHSGATNGKPWALYEITAVNPQGEPIDLKLKSFEKLDGEVEVEVERQEHAKYGVSYMLKRVAGGSPGGSPGARLGPKVDELRDRVAVLEEQVEFMRKQISSLNAVVNAGSAPAPPPAPEPDEGARFGGDDDIPF